MSRLDIPRLWLTLHPCVRKFRSAEPRRDGPNHVQRRRLRKQRPATATFPRVGATTTRGEDVVRWEREANGHGDKRTRERNGRRNTKQTRRMPPLSAIKTPPPAPLPSPPLSHELTPRLSSPRLLQATTSFQRNGVTPLTPRQQLQVHKYTLQTN